MDPISLAESRGANIVLATEISSHLVRRMIAPGDLIRVLDQAGVHFVPVRHAVEHVIAPQVLGLGDTEKVQSVGNQRLLVGERGRYVSNG